MSEAPEQIEIPEWWRPGGGMMYNRKFLPSTHPESEYQYVKRTYNVNPEDYGVFHSDLEDVSHMTREELLNEVMKMKSEFRELERNL